MIDDHVSFKNCSWFGTNRISSPRQPIGNKNLCSTNPMINKAKANQEQTLCSTNYVQRSLSQWGTNPGVIWEHLGESCFGTSWFCRNKMDCFTTNCSLDWAKCDWSGTSTTVILIERQQNSIYLSTHWFWRNLLATPPLWTGRNGFWVTKGKLQIPWREARAAFRQPQNLALA